MLINLQHIRLLVNVIYLRRLKQLSAHAKSTRAEIQWREIAGMRDKMIHEYFGVNLEIVWAVVERNLPLLKQAVAELLAESDHGP